jgi:hypothetical protein
MTGSGNFLSIKGKSSPIISRLCCSVAFCINQDLLEKQRYLDGHRGMTVYIYKRLTSMVMMLGSPDSEESMVQIQPESVSDHVACYNRIP